MADAPRRGVRSSGRDPTGGARRRRPAADHGPPTRVPSLRGPRHAARAAEAIFPPPLLPSRPCTTAQPQGAERRATLIRPAVHAPTSALVLRCGGLTPPAASVSHSARRIGLAVRHRRLCVRAVLVRDLVDVVGDESARHPPPDLRGPTCVELVCRRRAFHGCPLAPAASSV